MLGIDKRQKNRYDRIKRRPGRMAGNLCADFVREGFFFRPNLLCNTAKKRCEFFSTFDFSDTPYWEKLNERKEVFPVPEEAYREHPESPERAL